MGYLSNFEEHLDRAVDAAAGALFRGSITPAQISKRASKEMMRRKLVSAGRQFAPTLYTVLVSVEDDANLSGMYPTLAAEIETYLKGAAEQAGLTMDGAPLVRFIVDEALRRGRFEVIAENISAGTIDRMREELMETYGLADQRPQNRSRRSREREVERDDRSQPRPDREASDEKRRDRVEYEGSYDAYEDGYAQPLEERPVRPRRSSSVSSRRQVSQEREVRDRDRNRVEEPEEQGKRRRTVRTVPMDDDDKLFDHKTGREFQLTGSRLSIGREKDNDIVIADPNVSRHHGEFVRSREGWVYKDLGSTNGTHVNGEEISQCALFDGDVIMLGASQLEFVKG